MIRHQAIGIKGKIEFFMIRPQPREIVLIIFVAQEGATVLISTGNNMIEGAWKFDTGFARHGNTLTNPQFLSILNYCGLTPYLFGNRRNDAGQCERAGLSRTGEACIRVARRYRHALAVPVPKVRYFNGLRKAGCSVSMHPCCKTLRLPEASIYLVKKTTAGKLRR